MAIFSVADIPSTVTTYEQLLTWAALALKAANPGVFVYQGADLSGEAFGEIAAAISYLDVQPGDFHCFAAKIVFRARRDWQAGLIKPWEAVDPLSTNAVPAAFKASA